MYRKVHWSADGLHLPPGVSTPMFESIKNTPVLPVAVTPRKTTFGLSWSGTSCSRTTFLYFFSSPPWPKRMSTVYVKRVVFFSVVVLPVLPVLGSVVVVG